MKKVFLVLTLLCGMVATDVAIAQERYPVFSGALGGGSGGVGVRRTFYRPYGGGEASASAAAAQRQQRVQRTKKTIVKYAPNQIQLTEKQMEKLMPLIRRIQDGKIESLEIVGICEDYDTVYHRLTSLDHILSSYDPGSVIHYREISGPAVIPSNNNTVEFIEYY